MGQYSQWLYHREIDHQLQARLDTLTQELHALQEQAAQLDDISSPSDNPILLAIAMQQSARALLEDTPTPSTNKLASIPIDQKKQPAKSVSSALFGWSNLPNLDTQNIQVPATEPDTWQPEARSYASTPHPDINLLPGDMASFIDTHEQTLPQIQTPNQLRKDTRNTPVSPQSGPDERTNTSIQRWLERWGKQLPESLPFQEQSMPHEVSDE